ncbi:methyltransferase domain-containing protein [Methylobacterium trifolii]|uniref:Class I SAM-dependent methyltransferase n=1 Tax=Methylobacterium trifolii TaxID=1003092 RepID=A0ABQ4U482_9HYPH|nr:methyltransferase domain-containing protein [Methylobacterium trifolii]GJE62293.1 hypothetical protein MPOCJGCO_4426 [Methylobacterium trifolii]
MLEATLGPFMRSASFRKRVRNGLNAVGFDTTDWVRVVMYRECFAFVRSLDPQQLDALEISGGLQWSRAFDFRSYSATAYPGFDICAETMERRFDLIIADQVFEHLKWPMRAGRNVYQMLRPGGHFIICTPFMIRVHASPIDCSRWTEQGLSCLLQECGFPEDAITTASWGNRACVKSNFLKWRRHGWYRSLRNEPDFPVMVWAYARKPLDAPAA